MTRVLVFTITALIVPQLAIAADSEKIDVAKTDWPWWRGPNRDGLADPKQKPPTEWNASKNVLWKAELPGRGHGSATVVGNQVFIATADKTDGVQAVHCFDRKTGKPLWKTVVHKGGLSKKGNRKASQASTTIACDGKRLFVNFLNNKAIYTTALSRDGKRLWQKKITDYTVHQGYGSSPAIYGPLVIVSADNKGGGAIAGLNRKTGDVVWNHDRPKTPNYASPIILKAAGKEQLVFTGCKLVSSYDPLSGKKLWEIPGATTECVTSTVTDGKVVFSSGGYPKNHVAAVAADGSGKVVWEKPVRVYVPSMLVKDGYLYAVTDRGVAMCWEAATGKEMWKQRLGGTFSASPVLVGETMYAVNERGTTFVFNATPKGYKLIAKNQLGSNVLATPTICGGRIYMRVAEQKGGKRQEMLYCIGIRE